jgi:hypothetical protein
MQTNISDSFHPTKAIQTLKNNANGIIKLGNELHKKRIEYIKVKANLMDAESLSRRLAVNDPDLKVSIIRDVIKDGCAEQQKIHDILLEEIRDLKEQMEVLVEVNNSLKASHRILELEIKNQM